jgi:hypothetical protein
MQECRFEIIKSSNPKSYRSGDMSLPSAFGFDDPMISNLHSYTRSLSLFPFARHSRAYRQTTDLFIAVSRSFVVMADGQAITESLRSPVLKSTSTLSERLVQIATTVNRSRADELQKRLVSFAGRIVRLARSLPRSEEGRHISKQILRCGTATSANYGEARAAESRADFIHKMRVVLKELN